MSSKSKSKSNSKVQYSHIIHPYSPIYSPSSKILILGSLPSPASRESGFYYMHMQNRFWTVMQSIFNVKFKYKNNEGQNAVEERKNFLLNHDIALWDVIKSCDIKGAGDSSIKNAIANNFKEILEKSSIKKIFCTGTTAFKYWNKLCKEKYKNVKAYLLPSTSPANQKYWPTPKLVEEYKKNILPLLNVSFK